MKIAILMSTYNGEKYLDKQLNSISQQTVAEKITLYIRDDGSTDSTISIIEKWSKSIDIVLFREGNLGPAKSFWALFNNTHICADYYLFCDQDDIWEPDKVERQINELLNDTHLCICNCSVIDTNDTVIRIKKNETLTKIPIEKLITIENLFVCGVSQGCSMAFTDDLRKFIINCNVSCVPMHDIVLMLYAYKYGQIKWIEDPLFKYRMHNNNVVAKTNKSIFKRIKTTVWNWKNSSLNSMSSVATELLSNFKKFTETEERFLVAMRDYKSSFSKKMYLINNKSIYWDVKGIIRSYRIRILMNLF